jgi:uncharacterized protein (DUF2236 family)
MVPARTAAPERSAPGPGSLTWTMFADVRGLLLAPATLILQVGHPVVGAGVADHSRFTRDPWRRLLRTVASTIRFTYGTDVVAAAEADRLRELHRGITGTDPQGRRYSALDPAASAWVHLTLAHFAVDVRRVLAQPLAPEECDRFYREWRQVGRRLGVPAIEMPADWPGFRDYFDRMVSDVLEDNAAVRDVLAVAGRPPAPWRVPAGVWDPVATRAGRLQRLFTVGTLPPVLRERLDLTWTRSDARQLDRRAAAIRAALRPVPAPLRSWPQIAPHAVAAWRRGERRR